MNQNQDIMVDIETFATDTNAAIVSIGAVAFNADGDNASLWTNSPDALAAQGQGFRVSVDLAKSAPDKRGGIDPATVEWWLLQSDEARASLVAGRRMTLGEALLKFSAWIQRQGDSNKLRLWSNGPTFDETILRAAFMRHGFDFPVSFRGSRCCRTLTDLARKQGWSWEQAIGNAPDDITRHDALSDAVHQARANASQHHFLRLASNHVR